MNAGPLLHSIAAALRTARLEAVLVGNAGAALHGAPVTTLDFDVEFRQTPTDLGKLKRFAAGLGAVVRRPYYPASRMYRVMNADRGLQVDFLANLHGVRSWNSLRSRARVVTLGKDEILVADLADIIASKRAAGRPTDRAVLPVLEETLREQEKQKP